MVEDGTASKDPILQGNPLMLWLIFSPGLHDKVSRTREASAESWWRSQFILKAPMSQSHESNAKEMIEWTVNKLQFVTFLSFVATYRV